MYLLVKKKLKLKFTSLHHPLTLYIILSQKNVVIAATDYGMDRQGFRFLVEANVSLFYNLVQPISLDPPSRQIMGTRVTSLEQSGQDLTFVP